MPIDGRISRTIGRRVYYPAIVSLMDDGDDTRNYCCLVLVVLWLEPLLRKKGSQSGNGSVWQVSQ